MARIQLNVRLDKHPELSEALKQKAKELKISVNQVAILAFEQFLVSGTSINASSNASAVIQESASTNASSASTSMLVKRLAVLEGRVLQLSEDDQQRDRDIVDLAEGLREIQARDSNPGSPFKDWKTAKGD